MVLCPGCAGVGDHLRLRRGEPPLLLLQLQQLLPLLFRGGGARCLLARERVGELLLLPLLLLLLALELLLAPLKLLLLLVLLLLLLMLLMLMLV